MGDLLFCFTEWLRNTPLNDVALAISESAPTLWIGEHFWAIPIFQIIHIMAISASFASVLMINARMLKLAGHSSLEESAARYLADLKAAASEIVKSIQGQSAAVSRRPLLRPGRGRQVVARSPFRP